MIEPTETQSKASLDEFADALLKIAEEARTNPQLLHDAPHSTPVSRLDMTRAAREPILRYKPPAAPDESPADQPERLTA
jgi:glycine dehydrogenase subunit 2